MISTPYVGSVCTLLYSAAGIIYTYVSVVYSVGNKEIITSRYGTIMIINLVGHSFCNYPEKSSIIIHMTYVQYIHTYH